MKERFQKLEKFKKVNGLTLKLVACITMLIDHIGAGLLYPAIRYGVYDGNLSAVQVRTFYIILRLIGRIAFPIFAFLLVEGFFHTKSRIKYALNLLIFGLISEVPFDLMFYAEDEVFNINIMEALTANRYILMNQCNVYFTLLFGLLTIWGIDSVKAFFEQKNLNRFLYLISVVPICAAGSYVAYYLNTDYDLHGVILITIFYLLKQFNIIGLLAGYAYISTLSIEFASLPGFILMFLYNGKRGPKIGNLKYLFYIYYPVHLLIIYICRCLMYGV